MINDNKAILNFEDVAVKYRLPHEGVSGIKEFAIRLLQGRIQYEEFWALRGVSFQVYEGDFFGIIGRNGAGKSTMLKVMARVLQPTSGRVVMRGYTAPLLELGGGFHPELTGRENIFLNMALLGFNHRQISNLFNSIVEFSGIPEFIDSPLRTYSTGMIARLGFSVATCVRPDILLVDEVLSVGDIQFQQKCLERMTSFRSEGTTIIIVSHDLKTVQAFCDSVLWLDHGEVQAIGEPSEIIDNYVHMDNPEPVQVDISGEQKEYFDLQPQLHVYSAKNIFSHDNGTVSAWVKLTQNYKNGTAVLFHTDDSRYILFLEILFDHKISRPYLKINARGGGNQRAPNLETGTFPEISTKMFIDEIFPEQWINIVMTWQGYPEGKLQLFVDGKSIGELKYSSIYSNDQPLPENLSVGMRPLKWSGERIHQPDGSYIHSGPESTHSISDTHLELYAIRLYKRVLQPEEVIGISRKGHFLEEDEDKTG